MFLLLVSTLGCRIGEIYVYRGISYEVVSGETRGPREGVAFRTRWESAPLGGRPLSIPPFVVFTLDQGVTPQVMKNTGLVSYSAGFFEEPVVVVQRTRIPLVTNGTDDVSVINGINLPSGWSASIQKVPYWVGQQLLQIHPGRTFFMLTIEGQGHTTLSGEVARIIASGNVEVEWCQTAMGAEGCDSTLYQEEREAAQKLDISLKGSVWENTFLLTIREGETRSKVSIKWEAPEGMSSVAQLLSVDPGEVFFASITEATKDGALLSLPAESTSGMLVCQSIAIRRRVHEALVHAAPMRISPPDSIAQDKVLWKTRGQTIAIPREAMEDPSILMLSSPNPTPSGKFITTWGEIREVRE